jgi:glutamine amidotransferase
MCRLLGVVASEATDFRFALHQAPRSLALLSREHPHGWGVAVYGSPAGWSVQKRPAAAHEDDSFHQCAIGTRGAVLLAHVRYRTVGSSTLENTHPFRSGRWVFAHNGTITDTEYLRAESSTARLAYVTGETDSELFFAYLLTRLDKHGLTDHPASGATDALLRRTMSELVARPNFGACNFLLSDGETLYAHRFGRTLCLLERVPQDPVRTSRVSIETGASIETDWTSRRRAVLVASEKLSDEPWVDVGEGELLRVDRSPKPAWRKLG